MRKFVAGSPHGAVPPASPSPPPAAAAAVPKVNHALKTASRADFFSSLPGVYLDFWKMSAILTEASEHCLDH